MCEWWKRIVLGFSKTLIDVTNTITKTMTIMVNKTKRQQHFWRDRKEANGDVEQLSADIKVVSTPQVDGLMFCVGGSSCVVMWHVV